MQLMKKFINGFFCHFIFRVRYKNLEVLKKYDQYLICPNHSNVFDPAFIYPKVDNLYFVAKKELFKHTLVAKFLRHYHAFPVDRQKVDVKSTMQSLSIFENDKNAKLLIFPEGRVIKKKDDMGRVFKKGAVYISASAGIPIIPTFITFRPMAFSKVWVIFGEPIFFDKSTIKNKEDFVNNSKKLIEDIYKLKKEVQ